MRISAISISSSLYGFPTQECKVSINIPDTFSLADVHVYMHREAFGVRTIGVESPCSALFPASRKPPRRAAEYSAYLTSTERVALAMNKMRREAGTPL
jgi:hypothetical protein